MTPPVLEKSISKGDFLPLYYLYGENSLAIDKIVESLKTAIFPSGDPGLGLELFDAQTDSASAVITAARTLAFGATKKLVVVKNTHLFKADQVEKFGAYFSSPSKQTCLVFTAEKQVFKGKALTALKKSGEVEKFEHPKRANEIKTFIDDAFKSRGRKLSAEALAFMVDNTGRDLNVINNEIEKVVLFCGGQKSIAIGDVEAVLTAGSRTTIFDLIDAIGQGNVQASLLLLGRLVNVESHPLQILAMISRQFRLITVAGVCAEKGVPRKEIGQKIGVYQDFVVQKIVAQARGWSSRCLGKVFEAIAATDARLKSSRVEGRLIMEELVFRLVELRGQP